MNPNGIVKSFDVFKDEHISVLVISNRKEVEPFPFDKGVKGLDAGIILWIAFMGIATLHIVGSVHPSGRYILTATIGMNDKWLGGISESLCLMNCINHGRYLHRIRKSPSNDFFGE